MELVKKIVTYLRGHLLLFSFFFGQIPLLWQLPRWLTNPADLETHVKDLRQGKISEVLLKLPTIHATKYNEGMKKLISGMRTLHSSKKLSTSPANLILAVRCAMVVAAWSGNITTTLLVGLAQFLVAPYSMWVSFTQVFLQFHFIQLPHYIAFCGLSILSSLMLPYIPSFLIQFGQIPVNVNTILMFFLADQLFCIYISWQSTTAPDVVLRHAFHGFLNNKTMPLMLMLLMRRHYPSVSLWLWLLEGFFLQLTPRISTTIAKQVLHYSAWFYHHHRTAHVPHVYQQAHKVHHGGQFHGITAFDASYYACGIGEEYFLLVIELFFLQFVGLPPATFNFFVLITLGNRNKYGHTETDNKGYAYHTDHHKFHTKNFGSFNSLLDSYFSTSAIGAPAYNILPGGLTENGYNYNEESIREIKVSCWESSDDSVGTTNFLFTAVMPETQETTSAS